MPLPEHERDAIRQYCGRDLPGNLQWHIDQFHFISDPELRRRLGRAFYAARYMSKVMEALLASGDEIHAFVKFQITQYASIYEAVISNLIWGHYKHHSEVTSLETHKAYKRVSALASKTLMTFEGQPLHPCIYATSKTPRNSIPFKDKVDCAVRIGFVEEAYSEELKEIYRLRNLAHIEAEAKEGIDVEIQHAKAGYWRMKPFLEHIVATLASELPDSSSKSARALPTGEVVSE